MKTAAASSMEPPKPPLVPSKPAEVKSSSVQPPEKKRKRTVKRKPKAESSTRNATPPPTSILIIDNGGHSLKYGWATSSSPKKMPNMTAKLLHQWTVLVGDELNKVQPNQLESTTRSTERGIITNFSNQVQVWKRVLDDMGIVVPTTSEAAQVFGWKVARGSSTGSRATILPQSCAVLLLLPPLCPRTVLEQCVNTWFQEFHFGHVGIAVSPVMAADSPCSCVVDIGWSATNIVPTYHQKPISREAIRRMPLGFRHLIQLWKYYVSYRQWNLMDQEFLLEAVQEQLAFVSLDLDSDLRLARRVPLGRRPYDREFVLPDYSTTYKGYVRLPPALQRQAEEEKATEKVSAEETKDVTMKEEEGEEKNSKDDEKDGDENKDDSNDQQGADEDDEEEESDEAKRQRILRQRQEEERRRQELEAERQVLMVSVERFTIPEVLFRPSDAGLAANLAGLPEAIVASIAACPREYQAAMYQSIRIVGGLAHLSNLQERLERELRCLVPCQYELCVEIVDSPVDQAWLGAKKWVQQQPYSDWSIRMDEWEASRKDSRKGKAWHRLLADNGGAVV